MDETVFARATEVPCPVCLALAKAGELRREWVMPLPSLAPISMTANTPICFDCQSAENIIKIGALRMDFPAVRLTVGSERAETLRMPEGMAELMGMCSKRLVRPAHIGQLDDHFDWLDKVYPVEVDDD